MPKATSDGEAIVNPRFAMPLWHRVVGFYERFAPGRSLALLVSDYRNGNGWLPKVTSDGEALVNPRFALPLRHRVEWFYERFAPGRSLALLVSGYTVSWCSSCRRRRPVAQQSQA